ncbi:F-box domain-containing protein [Caenorhabditis elegans]|uniref:F-box domain-containing protein n=1 Tax=Caenorhabditis elegans TaxID=6239 RepID=O45336_CAEEL|nr:F-box domain-containing protein [Caenorhabditis elegans]CAB07341.1 F-box domain-containing protein [Caenorhabditis elegans]|eukprot:NP_507066.1 F-box A protein [Caenorhabditis elegans]
MAELEPEGASINKIKQSLFVNLPADVINEILKKLTPIDKLTLRKVCTFFRDTIDSKAYGFKIIEFHLLFDWVMLVLDKEIFKYASREQHGCWVSNGLNEHHFQEEYFLKLAIDDLAVILKDQSQKLDLLEVCVCDRATKRSRDYFFPALLKMLVTVDYRKIEKFDGDFPEIWDIWKKYQDTVLSSNK